MRDSISKYTKFFFPALSICLISCKATLPLQEISIAKQEVTRAKLFNSDKYAKAELDESRTNLFLVHETIAEPSPDLKKVAQLSQTATKKARLAINKSLPNYVKDLRQEVEFSLDAANIALAESLASDIYEQANLLKAEGDEIVKNADAKLAKNDPAGNEIAYNEYEKGIKRYKESILASEKARDLSLAQTQAVVDSSADIETNLDLIEKYSSKDKTVLTKITSLRAEYKSSVNMMESGSLRDGFKKAEKIRGESNELMTTVILPYAKERIKMATIKIEDADKLLNSNEDGAKSSVATDNLSAAKEAFTSSVDLLAKERFYDSIQQSDESIRLADEALKSKENANGDLSAKNRSSDSTLDKAREEADAKDSIPVKKKDKTEKTEEKPKVTDNKIQWRKHIVKKRIPPETLWRIAADKKYLGNKDLWKEIYKANKKDISNPNLIYPNQVILIPTKITKPKDKTKK